MTESESLHCTYPTKPNKDPKKKKSEKSLKSEKGKRYCTVTLYDPTENYFKLKKI